MNENEPTFMYQTARLGLKRLGVEELSGNYPAWFSDEEVNQYNSHFRKPETPAQVRRYVETLDDDATKLVFAIYWLETSTHLGNIAVQRIDHYNRSAELAFLLGEKSYWNKGVAYEATQIILRHCKNHLNLRRLYLGCFADNQAMAKLSEKLGFEQEGRLKEAIFGSGQYHDVLLYGLLL